jgi:integrase
MADNMADIARRGWKTGSVYQRSSDGRWLGTLEAGYTASGSRKRITVTGKTKTQVQRRLRAKTIELEREGRGNLKRTITVAKWAPLWLEDIRPKVRPKAYDVDRAAVNVIIEAIGAVKLADLSPADVRTVAKVARRNGLSGSTALRYHGTLMRMVKAASLDGYAIPPNVLLAENPTKNVSDRRAVTAAEAVKVLTHIATRPDGSRWALAFLQGLRQAEALGLTWEQVNLDAGTLTISWQLQALKYRERRNPAAGFEVPDGYEARHLVGAAHLVRPKSVAGWRVIPLVPWAVNALRAWREVAPPGPTGLVWPGRTVKGHTWPRNPAADRAEWHAIQSAAGIAHPTGRPYHVHEIRHGTATLLMELGVPESVRIAIMGHSSMAVTHGYEHVDVSQARAALEQAAARLQLDG